MTTAKHEDTEVKVDENLVNPGKTKKRTWQSKIIGWSKLDQHLNDLEDDGWEVEKIIEQKSFDDYQTEDYVLVVAKYKKATQKKRFY